MQSLVVASAATEQIPSIVWTWPFVAILLAIAILPLLRKTHHWWEQNSSKLLVAAILAVITLGYYYFRPYGVPLHGDHGDQETAHSDDHAHADNEHAHADDEHAHADDEHAQADEPAHDTPDDHAHDDHAHDEQAQAGEPAHDTHADHAHAAHRSEPGLPTVAAVLDHAVVKEYVPFLVLLFSLYVIAGGIVVRGDIRATPAANTTILAIGGALASFIGTTGAAMVLIRLLLKTNSERRRVVHTVVFFIFIVANIGGSLLPIGDPPLFLGYLRNVPFLWTMNLWSYWLFMLVLLLGVYFVWDTLAYRHEEKKQLVQDNVELQPISLVGNINFIWLLGVVLAVALLDPAKAIPGTNFHAFPFMREGVQLLMVAFSLMSTPRGLREENQFNYVAIGEVACLFIGIFITMQVPIEILNAKGAELGLTQAWQFFWFTGILSSFLDNAPTYVVFFETAAVLPVPEGVSALTVSQGREISEPVLYGISCGAVFMGANSYIGNGPNFMVKSIAEQSGIKMPSFFGYMAYSSAILIPLFVVLTLVFFR